MNQISSQIRSREAGEESGIRPEKALVVEVDHVVGSIGDPDMRFPCDGFHATAEAAMVGKGGEHYQVLATRREMVVQLRPPFFGHVPMPGRGIDEEQPISLQIMDHHIRHRDIRKRSNSKTRKSTAIRFPARNEDTGLTDMPRRESCDDLMNEVAVGSGHGLRFLSRRFGRDVTGEVLETGQFAHFGESAVACC